MKTFGIQLQEGSNISNLTVASGTAFPSLPNDGELFYRTDSNLTIVGLYCYINGNWDRISSADAMTTPKGAAFPSAAVAGDLFYLDSNDSTEGLYVYSGTGWLSLSGGTGGSASYSISGDVTGTIDGGSIDSLTLATVNSNVGQFGSALDIPHITVNAKGLVTAVSETPITFTITGDVSGTIDGGTDALTLGSVGTAGTYTSVTTDAKGRVTAGSNPGFITANETITLSGDVSGSGTTAITTTLPTVNINVGSFGTATKVGQFTVDGKGRITAASEVSISFPSTVITDFTEATQDVVGGFIVGANGVTSTYADVANTLTIGLSGVPNSALAHSAVTIGSTSVALGDTVTILAGLSSVTSTTFVGNLDGHFTTARTFSASGDASATGVSFDGSANVDLALALASVGTAGTYGSAANIPVFTTDAKGRVTSVTSTAISITESQIQDGSILARVGANETITGSWAFSNPVVGAAPTTASHFTTKQYVDNALAGLTWKHPVRVSTSSNISLSGTQTIDGVAVVDGDRVLVKNQTAGADNGVYIVNGTGVWSRSTDFDETAPIDEVNSAAVFVSEGTGLHDTGWTQINTITTVGTDTMVFVQFSGAGAYTAGTGMTLVGNDFRVNTADSARIVVGADDIDLAAVGTPVTDSLVKVTTDTWGRVSATSAISTADLTALLDATYVNVIGDTMTGNLAITETTNAASSVTVTNSSTGTGASARLLTGNGTDTAGLILYGTGHANVNQTTLFTTGSGNLLFQTGATEKMRITNAGQVLIGITAARVVQGAARPFQIEMASASPSPLITRNSNDALAAGLVFAKSRSTTVGGNAAVQLGDSLGSIQFIGADGTSMVDGATDNAFIGMYVDDTVALNSVPSRFSVNLTSLGATSSTERFRISSNGAITMGLWTAQNFSLGLVHADAVAGKRALLTLPAPVAGLNYTAIIRVVMGRNVNDVSGVNHVDVEYHVSRSGNDTGANAFFTVDRVIDNSNTTSIGTFAAIWYFDTATGTPYLRFGQSANSATYYVKVEANHNGACTLVLDAGTVPSGTVIPATFGISNNSTLNTLALSTGGNVQFQLDDQGRLGLGATPNAAYKMLVSRSDATTYVASGSASVIPLGSSVTALDNQSQTDGAWTGLVLAAKNTLGVSNISYVGNVSGNGVSGGTMVFGHRTAALAYAETMRIDTSGNLGLGTTAVGAGVKLHANLAGTASSTSIRMSNDTDASYGQIQYSGSTFARPNVLELVTGASTTPISMLINGNEKLRVENGQTIFKQTTGTLTNLVIQGDNGGVNTKIGAITMNRAFYDSTGTSGEIAFWRGNNAQDGFITFAVNSGQAGAGQAAAERMRIDSAGQVGIGKTPTVALDVVGSITATGTITGASLTGPINYISATNANTERSTGLMLLTNTTGSTNFQSTTGLTIEARRAPSSSSSDIGTFQLSTNTSGDTDLYFRKLNGWTTPSTETWTVWQKVLTDLNHSTVIGGTYVAKAGDTMTGDLTLAGTAVTARTVTFTRDLIPANGNTIGSVAFKARSDATTYLTGAMINALGQGTWTATSAPTYLSFQTTTSGATAPTEKMLLSNAGLLGIGMTPTQALDITKNGNASSAIQLTNTDAGVTADARLTLNNGTGTGGLIIRGTGYPTDGGATVLYASNGTSSVLEFFTNGNEKMRIDANGLVGIGGVAISRKLEVFEPTRAIVRTTSTASTGTDALSGFEMFSYDGTAVTVGASMVLNYSLQGTDPNALVLQTNRVAPIVLKTGGTERVRIDANGLTATAMSSTGDLTVGGNIILTRGSSTTISRNATSGYVALSGGASVIDGPNIILGGSTSVAQFANFITFRKDSVTLGVFTSSGALLITSSTTPAATGSEKLLVSNTAAGGVNAVAVLQNLGATTGTGVGLNFATATNGGAGITLGGIAVQAIGAVTTGVAVGDMIFSTATSSTSVERMRLTGSGMLGVNTGTSVQPLATIHAKGTPTLTSNSYPLNLRLDGTSAFGAGVGSGITFNGYTDAVPTMGGFASIHGVKENATSGNTAGALFFATTPNAGVVAERMRIDSIGNVGVGTTAPGTRLEVMEVNRANSSNATNLQVFTSDTATQDIGGTIGVGGYFNATTNKVVFGSIRGAKENATANNFSGYLAFQTIAQGGGLLEKMRIDSAGAIIVGNGDTNAAPAAALIRATNASGTDIAAASLTLAAGRSTGAGVGGSINLQTASASATGATLNALATRMSINQLGNVAIAAPSSGIALAIAGFAGNVPTLTLAGNTTTSGTSGTSDISINRSGTESTVVGRGASLQLSNTTTSMGVLLQHYAGGFQFYSSTNMSTWTELMRLDSTGDLMLGGTTGTPSHRLTVVAPDIDGIAIHNSSETTSRLYLETRGGTTTARRGVVQAWRDTVGALPLSLQEDGGNVGIGASAPVTKLTVQTAATAGVAIALNLNNPRAYGAGLGVAGSGLRFNHTPTDNGSTGVLADIYGVSENETTSTTGALAFATRTGAAEVTTERMRIDSAGNVGIGTATATTTAAGLLEVRSDQNASTDVYITNATVGTAARAGLFIRNGSGPNDAFAMLALSSTYAGVPSWQDAGVLTTSSGQTGGVILNDGASSGGIKFQIGAVEKMRLDSAGQVGIGTGAAGITQNAPLQVYQATGTLLTRLHTSTIDGRFSAGTGLFDINSAGANSLTLSTNSVARLTIDSTGLATFTGNVIGATPTLGTHLTTKTYVDNAILGLSWKAPVRVATTANITLSAPQTIDGVAVVAGDRVLVKNQTTASQNGIYVVAAAAWTRATDFDAISPIDEVNSAAMMVKEGTANADTCWTQTGVVATIGTDAMAFVQFMNVVALQAGAGLVVSGNGIGVATANVANIVVNADSIDLATVTQGSAGTSFVKVALDSYGRVTNNAAVTLTDINTLASPGTLTPGQLITGGSAFTGYASGVAIGYIGGGSQYGITMKPTAAQTAVTTNAIAFLTSASTAAAPVQLGAIQHLSNDAGLNLMGSWFMGGSALQTAATVTTTLGSYMPKSGGTFTGAITVDSNAQLDTITTAVTTTTATTIATFLTATFRTAKCLVQVTDTTNSQYHAVEMLLIHNGTTVFKTEYAEVSTNGALGTFDASITTGTLSLQFTATAATTKSVKVFLTELTV